MTNLQLVLTIGIPTLAVLASLLLTNGRLGDIVSRLITIEGDLRRFYQELGKLQGHVEAQDKNR